MSRRVVVQAAGLFASGAVIGGIIAGTGGASAASRAASPPPAPGTYGDWHAGRPQGMRPFAPGQSGTVTAVAGASVTIRSAAGTRTYAVTSDSDIDKNGEATLADLKPGDAVHFSVQPGTSTIAVLHAGDEAKNRPAGRGHDGMRGHCDGDGPGAGAGAGPGSRPAPTPTTSSGTRDS